MKKTFIMLLFGILCSTTVLSAQLNPGTVNAGLNQFIEDLTGTVPSTAVNQNVYADAFIGKLIPSVPPHLAVGVNTSFAILDTSGLKAAADALSISGILSQFVLPSFTVDARVGGLFLPFDVGFSFMKFPVVDLGNLEVEFLTWGADLRWALLQQGVIAPNISLGFGYYHSAGSMEASGNGAIAKISYKMNTIAFSAQISKTFLFLTPFVGGRFVMSDADNTYDWSHGTTGTRDSGAYKKSFGKLNQFNVYGGLSINIFIVHLTPSVSYDFQNDVLTATFSARVQL